MSLRGSVAPSLAAVGEPTWISLAAQCREASVFQSWPWLNAWWESTGKGRQFIVLVHENDELVGAGAFFIDELRVLRFIGDQHNDYGAVLAKAARLDIIEVILDAVYAAKNEWQRLALDAVRVGSGLAQGLSKRGALASQHSPCSRVVFAERPVAQLLGKSSLKRHAQKLGKVGPLSFLNLDTAAQILPWLEQFFQQHIERWALTSTPSLFLNPRNVEFYRKLAAQAVVGGPIVFTLVLVADRPVAMHFGFRSEGDLLWYKPTYDPRHAEAGPGEVLLAELLRQARRDGLSGLDFTRGDESFKQRFASEVREVALFEAWPSLVAGLRANCTRRLRHTARRMLQKTRLRRPVISLAGRTLRALRLWRNRGVGAVLSRANALWQADRQVPVPVYARHGTLNVAPSVPGFSALAVRTLDAAFSVLDVRDPQFQPLLEVLRGRLQKGDVLWLGQIDGTVVGFGWATTRSPLPVIEVQSEIGFTTDTTLLYDFQVLPAYRRHGYYRALLQAIKPESAWTVIYARADNRISRNGIEKAGFSPCGILKRHRNRLLFTNRQSVNPVLTVSRT